LKEFYSSEQSAMKKSWQQKLEIDRQPQVEKSDKDFAGIRQGQLMLIPTPLMVDAYIRKIPRGKQVDPQTMRRDLAVENHAEVTCPLTTGIFIRIAAEAAWEQYQKGTPLNKLTPFWRVIDEKSPTAKKLSFGTEFLKKMREGEKLIANS
jgi:hypothetical protein